MFISYEGRRHKPTLQLNQYKGSKDENKLKLSEDGVRFTGSF